MSSYHIEQALTHVKAAIAIEASHSNPSKKLIAAFEKVSGKLVSNLPLKEKDIDLLWSRCYISQKKYSLLTVVETEIKEAYQLAMDSLDLVVL